jgi:hypothetical protein
LSLIVCCGWFNANEKDGGEKGEKNDNRMNKTNTGNGKEILGEGDKV